jgi:hypothetical protein
MTLEEVRLEFETWRSTRKNKGIPIPKELWLKVYDIHQNYKPTQMCKALRLNGQQFKSKMAEFSSSTFVEIPINPITVNANHCCKIKLTHGNKALSFELPINYMDRITPTLKKLMQ